MIVEVLNEEDIYKVENKKVQAYLHSRFEEIEQPWDFKREGYFLYMDDVSLFDKPIQLDYAVLPSIEQGLFNRFENTMLSDGIIEMSVLINNELMFSIVMLEENLSAEFCKKLV